MSPRRKPGSGPSKTERLALFTAARSALYMTAEGLRLRDPAGRMQPVRAFSPAIVTACERQGWLMRHSYDAEGKARIMTTVPGDAALAKAMRLVRPRDSDADWQREALR